MFQRKLCTHIKMQTFGKTFGIFKNTMLKNTKVNLQQ